MRKPVFAVATAPFWSEELAAIDEKRAQVRQMGHYLNSKHKDHANADGKAAAGQRAHHPPQEGHRRIDEQSFVAIDVHYCVTPLDSMVK